MTKKEIRNLIQSIADVRVTFKREGFYYDDDQCLINVDLTDNDDRGFLRHLAQVHKCKFVNEFDLIVWSILHEVGHYFTFDEDDLDNEFNDRLALSVCEGADEKIQDRYFNLPSEWKATEWAIKYLAQCRRK